MKLIRYWLSELAMSTLYNLLAGLVFLGMGIYVKINPDTWDDLVEGSDAFDWSLGIMIGGSLALIFSAGEIRTQGLLGHRYHSRPRNVMTAISTMC